MAGMLLRGIRERAAIRAITMVGRNFQPAACAVHRSTCLPLLERDFYSGCSTTVWTIRCTCSYTGARFVPLSRLFVSGCETNQSRIRTGEAKDTNETFRGYRTRLSNAAEESIADRYRATCDIAWYRRKHRAVQRGGRRFATTSELSAGRPNCRIDAQFSRVQGELCRCSS